METRPRYNVIAFGFKTAEDESGMIESRSAIEQLISAEIESGIDPGRIVLFGFSQGAAMSVLTGLTSERKLGGIGVLSGWLPLRAKFKSVRYRLIYQCITYTRCIHVFYRWPRSTHQRSPYFGPMVDLIRLYELNTASRQLSS